MKKPDEKDLKVLKDFAFIRASLQKVKKKKANPSSPTPGSSPLKG